MRKTEPRARSPTPGACVTATRPHRSETTPTAITTARGANFATVMIALNRVALATPAIFSAANPTRIVTTTTACIDVPPSDGMSVPIASPKKTDTAAVAALIPAQRRNPHTNPTSGPSATST